MSEHTRVGRSIDGGWYHVDIADIWEEHGRIEVRLDPDSLVVNHRHPGYWIALFLMPFRALRSWLRGGQVDPT